MYLYTYIVYAPFKGVAEMQGLMYQMGLGGDALQVFPSQKFCDSILV